MQTGVKTVCALVSEDVLGQLGGGVLAEGLVMGLSWNVPDERGICGDGLPAMNTLATSRLNKSMPRQHQSSAKKASSHSHLCQGSSLS